MDWSPQLSQNGLAEPLALDGGRPVRSTLLPYARQSIDAVDIAAVTAVLQSNWLTTGPKVAEFERVFAAAVDVREAVAVSSGTAALHAAMHALAIGPGDEVIVPADLRGHCQVHCLSRGGRADVRRCRCRLRCLSIRPASNEL